MAEGSRLESGQVSKASGVRIPPPPLLKYGNDLGTSFEPQRYHRVMATNLRLSQQTALALQEAARKTGRSQQDLIRDAVEQYLGIGPVVNERARLIAAGSIEPGTPFEDVEPWVILPAGMSSLALLDRDEDR